MSEPWWIFPQRSKEPEILDDLQLGGEEHAKNLRELNLVNRWLGGHKILIKGLSRVLSSSVQTNQVLHVADLGCGGGDSLMVLANMARKKGIKLKLTGVDVSASAVAFAQKATCAYPEIEIRQMDVFSDEFRQLNADIFTFNLVLHHFDNDSIRRLLKECNKSGAVIVNDLQRNRLAYLLFHLISRLFGFSYIGRHDGLLSIKKSFSRSDWKTMLASTGIKGAEVSWRWAFRYLVLIPMSFTN